jgi:class 3 adenylate cyclase
MDSPLHSRRRWYELAPLPRRWGVLGALGVGLLWTVINQSPLGRWLNDDIGIPVSFQFRTFIGADPGLDPRLRVWVLGESSLGKLGKNDLTLEQWSRLFSRLSTSHPRAIFVDKMFSLKPDSEAAAAQFVNRLKQISTPIVVGSQVISLPVDGRVPLPWDHPSLQLSRWSKDLALPTEVPQRRGAVYGPHPSLLPAFSRVSHMMFLPGGYVEPLLQLNDSNMVAFPPWSLARDVKADSSGIFLDGHRLPLNAAGRMLVNLSALTKYRPRLNSLSDLVEQAEKGEPIDLPPDSIVVILTSYAAGEHSHFSTPIGPTIPALLHLALIQSLVTGHWLGEIPFGFVAILSFAMIAVGLMIFSPARWAPYCLAAGAFIAPTLGLLLFVYADTISPWVSSLGAYLSTVVIWKTVQWRRRSRTYQSLIDRFEGLLPPDKLKALGGEKGRSFLQPRAEVVSVLFLDIVGFSAIAERLPPEEVFSLLRALFQEISVVVHKWGGIIDKTLGDGLLAYFGVGDPPEGLSGTHADWALGCAQEIQKMNAERVAAAPEGQVAFPFRIGINSSGVVLGDLGEFRRVDFTLIGHGVNLAKRFESACEPFRILMGTTTHVLLTRPEHLNLFSPVRCIPIKGQAPLEVREVDPLRAFPELSARAGTVYRKYARLKRIDTRVPCQKGMLWARLEGTGAAEVLNFSRGGFSFVSSHYLGKGLLVTLTLHLGSADGPSLTEHPLVCSVRWGSALGDNAFLHGVNYENVNAAQREALEGQLLRAVTPLKQVV